jgi:hypothetical protein
MRTNYKGDAMSAEGPTQDPQDKAFGAAASRDQDIVDPLVEEAVTKEELPGEPTRHPRAGGKAEPAGTPAEYETGAEKAAQNREEDPPA